MTSAPTLVVLAAGIGSRYGGLKQIEPIGPSGEICLDYSLYDAARAGFGVAVLVIRPELEHALRARLDGRVSTRIEIKYAHQQLDDIPAGVDRVESRTKPWGTAHAVWAARHQVREPFAVINADDFYGPASYRKLADFLRSECDPDTYAMVAFVLRNTLSRFGSVSRGICSVRPDGMLERVVERTRIVPAPEGGATFTDEQGKEHALTGDEAASMNMWGFASSLFDRLTPLFKRFLRERADEARAEFFLPAAVDTVVAAGQCRTRVLRSADKWYGITYPQDRPAMQEGIRELIARGIYPEDLWGRN